MASETRKMATVRKVADVVPIENADRIEVTVVDGWRVITKRGEFERGDLCVYLEIDTFCPTTVEPLAFLSDRGTKTMVVDGNEVQGHVLKTIKLRGVISQGLCLRPSEFGISDGEANELHEGDADVSERIGVWEYVRPVRQSGSPKYILNPYDRSVAPVTDAERVQNCADIWDALRRVEAYCTVKVDGTSMTMVFDPRKDKLRLFSHHREIDYTEPSIAQVSYEAARRQGILDFCMGHPGITVQYELTGPSIQRKITKEPTCHVFAVWNMFSESRFAGTEMHKYDWAELCELGWDAVTDNHVKVLDWWPGQFETPQDLLEAVDDLRGNVMGGRKDALDEGVVFHIDGRGNATDFEWQRIQNKLKPNMEFKAVSNRYLLKG